MTCGFFFKCFQLLIGQIKGFVFFWVSGLYLKRNDNGGMNHRWRTHFKHLIYHQPSTVMRCFSFEFSILPNCRVLIAFMSETDVTSELPTAGWLGSQRSDSTTESSTWRIHKHISVGLLLAQIKRQEENVPVLALSVILASVTCFIYWVVKS